MSEKIMNDRIVVADTQIDAEFKRGIIASLKSVKAAQNLSISEIERMVDATGVHVASSTLYRVFAEDSETCDSFSYDRTLHPIEKALLVNNETTADAVVRAQLDTYLHICKYKMEVIESLHAQVDKLKDDLLKRSEEYDKRIAFLQEQISLKDTRMDRKDETIDMLLKQLLVCKDCARRRGE